VKIIFHLIVWVLQPRHLWDALAGYGAYNVYAKLDKIAAWWNAEWPVFERWAARVLSVVGIKL